MLNFGCKAQQMTRHRGNEGKKFSGQPKAHFSRLTGAHPVRNRQQLGESINWKFIYRTQKYAQASAHTSAMFLDEYIHWQHSNQQAL